MRKHLSKIAQRLLLRGMPLLLSAALPALITTAASPAPASAQGADFSTLILSPDAGSTVPQTTTMVAVSFIDPGRLLDVSSVRLMVDGVDQTGDATVNADVIVWRPPQPLRQGVHAVVVTARTRGGASLPVTNWSFVIGPPPEGVIPGEITEPSAAERRGVPGWAMLRGNLTVEGSMLSLGGDGADFRREPPATGKAWLNISGRLGGSWRYQAYSHVSSQESHTIQPINRFRLGVRSNWLSLSVGDVTPNIQELVLWGRRVRGWSLDLRTGPFNVAVVSGESRRAVDGQLFDDPTSVYRRGTFAQDLFAIRPYFAVGSNSQFGITFMKVRDDVGSIEDLRTTPDAGGATVSANSTPKDNVVVGIDLSTSAFNNRFTIRYDNAYSLYANDISGGPFTKAEFDSLLEENGTKGISLNPEKLESFFILNASMIPIDPRGLTNTAQQLRASLQLGTHTIGFRWRSVGGSYYTLGQTSLQRDRAGLRLQDSFRMFGNALGVTVGWEQSRDNLDGSKADDTGTSALTLDLAYQADPLAPGFAVGYRTFGRQNDLPTLGEGGVEENTATYSAGAFLPVRVLSGMRSRININYTNVGREDALNPQTGTDNIYYLVGFASRFEDRPTDFSVTYGLNQSKLTGFTDANTTFNRLLLKGRHGLSESLFATGDVTLTTATSPEPPGGSLVQGLKYSRTELLLGGEYYWTPTSFASLRAGFATYKDDRRSNLDTSEFALKLRLVRAF